MTTSNRSYERSQNKVCFPKQEAEKKVSRDDKGTVENSGTDFMGINYA